MESIQLAFKSQADMDNFTYSLTYPILFALLEIDVSIIISCIPLLGPIFYGTGKRRARDIEHQKYGKMNSSTVHSGPSFAKNSVTVGRICQNDDPNVLDDEIPLRDHVTCILDSNGNLTRAITAAPPVDRIGVRTDIEISSSWAQNGSDESTNLTGLDKIVSTHT
jgi:hypothetical protein